MAYIRGHAPWPPRLQDQPPIEAAIETVAFLRLRAPDVHAALTVLGRGRFADPDPDAPQLDLADTDLRRAYLNRADLRRARLYGADLRRARFDDTDLQGATLTRANLQEAHLLNANLQDAVLHHADLDADLTDANLQGAGLRHANLQGAKPGGADLRDAELDGVDLPSPETGPSWRRGSDTRDRAGPYRRGPGASRRIGQGAAWTRCSGGSWSCRCRPSC